MSNKFQKGFIFRQENCVGCGGCSVACQIHNELPEDVRFRKVDLYEVTSADGRVRDVWFSHACMHRPVWQFVRQLLSQSALTGL
ncbi:hypothetical protein [Parasutterella excrementihominis]|uniref:hypothetical protein n=1 Tax=Parasutterella excrementihominis TaxID=487175 RepID=UPI003521B129